MKLLRRYHTLLTEQVRTLLAPAHDPRDAFTAAARRQHALLDLVRQALADLRASRDQLSAKLRAVEAGAAQLDLQARMVLQRGRDDLARIAIQRQQRALAEADLLTRQVAQMNEQEQRLRLHEQQINEQIAEFVARLNAVAARYSAAEAQVRMQEALSGLSHGAVDLQGVLERAEQETEDIHARASALERLIAVGMLDQPGLSGGDTLDRRLTQVLADEVVSERLAALRAELDHSGGDQPVAAEER